MRLQEFLRLPEIKVAAFAERVGRDKSVVARWKRGETTPDVEIWPRIIEATCGVVTATDLLPRPSPDTERPAA
jgi:transcriptional regulator with XRE-family HTH domain